MNEKRLKICIACSSGGHYREALTATQLLNGDKYFVTYRTPHISDQAQKNRFYFVTHCKRNVFKIIRNAIQSYKILRKEKPDVIISTGADVAVPTCILGKMMGIKLIFIESGGQVYTPSLSGRMVYPLADLFMIQWEPLLRKFPRAQFGGPLF